MMLPSTTFILLLLSYAHVIACDDTLHARGACSSSYTVCSPKGAATTNEPPIGTGISSLFVDVVDTLDSANLAKREAGQDTCAIETRASGGSLCCADGTICLLLQDFELSFCYDNYTTNFFLPGGSYGQVHDGSYTSTDGSTANLLTGNYTLGDGSSGNIYGTPATPPNTATLTLPTQDTASGVGSAIPVTALGQEVTYTTTIPGTTVSPSVISTTISALTITGGSTVGSVMAEALTTVPGSTVAPEVTTVTTRLAASATRKSFGTALMPNISAFVSAFVMGLVLRRVLI
ncbi:hypothetical protein HO173_006508 [Letharia columbiana]|uniref:Uncharacterized protein n=1 Tax=Letharia columbiana TaxID=112416 RepID=A0A8H6FV20_9LECA|nr:uncharacterized protein HO173_006508 [Letharia columbiana]KAF6235312.1 hypothetical protein HO173_006508 [Letharia columbiana]